MQQLIHKNTTVPEGTVVKDSKDIILIEISR